MTWRRRGTFVVAAAGLALVLGPVAADAHAVLEEAIPANGAVLAEQPSEVTLRFNELVSVREGVVTVLGPAGNTVAIDDPYAVDTTVHIPLPPGLGEGSYVVSWRVISADDHPVAGALVFSIGTPTAGVGVPHVTSEASAGFRVVQGIVTFASYIGVMGAVGLLAFAVFVQEGRRAGGILRWSLVAAAAGAAGVVATIPLQVVEVVGGGLESLTDGSAWRDVVTGPAGPATLTTFLGLGIATWTGRRWPRTIAADAAVAAGAVLSLAGFVAVGHTRTFGPWWLVVSSDLIHLVAGAIWLGGLIGLASTLRSHAADSESPGPAATAGVVARFSTLAGGSLILVGVFGTLQVWRIAGSWGTLLGSTYGRVLLVKVAVVAVVALLGAYNRFRLLPATANGTAGDGRRRLRRTVRIEAALLACAIAVTAVLVEQNPAATASATAPSEAVTVDIDLDGVSARLSVTPGRSGANRVTIDLVDEGPVDALEDPVLDLTLTDPEVGPIEYVVPRTAPGRYETEVDFPLPGDWELRLTVRISTYVRPIGVTTIEIGP